jgi:hypothetical protein
MKLSPVTRMACCHSELNPKPTVEVDIGSPNLFQILNIIIEAITENSHSLPTIPAKKHGPKFCPGRICTESIFGAMATNVHTLVKATWGTSTMWLSVAACASPALEDNHS